MEDFEAFKSFRAMRWRQMERNEQKTWKEKEWDLASIHNSQMKVSDETEIKDKRNEKKLGNKERSKKEVSFDPSCSKKERKNSHKDREMSYFMLVTCIKVFNEKKNLKIVKTHDFDHFT